MYKAPSPKALEKMMDLAKFVVFPDYSDVPEWTDGKAALKEVLIGQLMTVDVENPEKIAQALVDSLPEITRLLNSDVKAVAHNDPAVCDLGEVILSYPLTKVMLHYRVAHRLYELGVPRIPRMITEIAHSATGIDIHPAAKIGEYFAIDHGTGVVIGATAVIGNHVMLYQGVTLGAKNFSYDPDGHPLDTPRHPILEDNVTVYSNTSILGRVTIGHDTVVGGNIWLTHSVPPYSRLVQGKALEGCFGADGAGI
ncbi:MAG: serine O-acetyltransferase [Bacteroidales bacterium]|nr:serine O-acetyltransferase [Bacteroidales bacterium]